MKKRTSIIAIAILLLCTVLGHVYAEDLVSEGTQESEIMAISADDIAEADDWVYKKEQYNTNMSDAYVRRNVSEESVSTQTGVLTLSQVDYAIPLTEGQFELRRIFNSNMACADYGYNGNAVAEMESFITKTYRLGEGWRYSFPTLELFIDYDKSSLAGGHIDNIMYHSESGQVYSIMPKVKYTLSGSNYIEEKPVVTYTIDNHNLKDIEFEYVYGRYTAGVLNNTNYVFEGFKITHRKQKVVYNFGTDGKINSITYNGVDTAEFVYKTTTSSTLRGNLESIVVTTGGIENKIEFGYGKTGTQDYNSVVKVSLPNGKDIEYVYEKYDVSDEYYGHRVITDVYDIDGYMKYSFDVSKKDVQRKYKKKITEDVYVYNSGNITMNVIDSIYYHKSNKKSSYNYTVTENATNDWQYYNVESHQDYEMSGSKIGGVTTYSYPTGDAVYEDDGMYTEKFTGESDFWKQNEYARADSGDSGSFLMQDNCMKSWLRMHSEIFSNKQYSSDYVVEATVIMGRERIMQHSSGGIIFAVSDYKRGNNNFNGYYARIKPDEGGVADDQIALMKMTAGGDGYNQQAETLATASFAEKGLLETCDEETPYRLKVKMDTATGKIEFYINGVLVIEYVDDNPYPFGSVGLRSYQRRMFVTSFRVAEGDYTSDTTKTETYGDYEVVTKDTYDYESNLISQSVTRGDYRTETLYEYDNNRMPKSITVNEYCNSVLKQSKTESYKYDDYGNVIQYFGPMAKERYYNGGVVDRNPGTVTEESTEVTEVVTGESAEIAEEGTDVIEESTEAEEEGTEAVDEVIEVTEDDTLYAEGTRYTYDYESEWFLPVKVEYLVNDEITARTEYDLTADDARIETERVYQNNDLVKVTGYYYDSYGRVVSKSVKASDDEDESEYLTSYSYGELNSNSLTYTVTEKQRVTVDDEDTTDVDETKYITKTIEKYALNGSVKTETCDDVSVSYEYYDDERVKSITYGDGTSVSYEYGSSPVVIIVKDEEGNVRKTEYDAYGRVTAIYSGKDINSLTMEAMREYDARGNMVKSTDGRGVETVYTYDSMDRMTSQTVDGFVTEYEYSYEVEEGSGQTLMVVTTRYRQEEGEEYTGSEKVCYDLENKEVYREDGNGNKTKYVYDYANNKISETDGKGNETKYEYDALNRVVKVTYATGDTEEYTYTALDKIETKTEDGYVYKYTYDGAGRLTREAVSGYYTKYVYSDRGNVTQIEKGIVVNGSDVMSEKTAYWYDKRDRVTGASKYRDEDRGATTRYEYDGCGNTVKITEEVTNTVTNVTDKTYDYAGRVTSEALTKVEGTTTTILCVTNYEYDKAGNLTKKTAVVNYAADTEEATETEEATDATETDTDETVTEEYEYDGRGLLTKKTAANGLVTSYASDARGALVSESYVRNAGEEPITKTYAYDNAGRMIEEADGEGNVTKYVYDGAGNVVNKIDPRYTDTENSIEYSYDGRNRLTSTIKKENGSSVTLEVFKYDSRGNVTEKQQGDIVTMFTYDGLGNVLTQTDGEGVTERYTYDGSGRVVRYTDGKDSDTSYTYWLNGTPDTVTYADNTVITYVYEDFDRTGSYKVTSRDRMNNVTVTEYNVWGMPEKVTYADGLCEEYTYDMLGRKTSYTNREGTVVKYGYDESGNMIKEAVYSNGELVTQKSYTYSKDNLLTSETDGEGNRTEYEYDKAGNVTKITYANGTSDTFTYQNGVLATKVKDGVTTNYTYDVAGRLVAEKVGDRETKYEYDAAGNVTKKSDNAKGEAEYQYDKAGRLILEAVKRAENEYDVTQYRYDANGNVIVKTVGTEPAMVTRYTYDCMNNLQTETVSGASLTDGVVTTYEVDKLGRVTKQVYNSGDSYSAETTCYYYDEMGNMYSVKDANGNYTLYNYDELGRVTEVADGVSDSDITSAITVENYEDGNDFDTAMEYGYDCMGNVITEKDGNGNVTTYVYDKASRLVKVINAKGDVALAREYDGKGNITAETDGNTNTEKYEYTNNRLVKKTDRMNAVEEYVYNGYGEIAELKAPGYTEGTIISTKYAYDKAGRLTTVTMADDSKVGYTYDLTGNVLTQTDGEDNVTEYTYYPFGRVKSKTDAEGNEESYVYDVFGNVTKKTDGNGVVINYTYDAKSNLTRVTDGDKISIVYSYDKMNNRKSMLDGTGSSYTYVYNARGQVTGVKYGSADYVQYTYDNAGNTTSYKNVLLGSETAYTYDALNRVLTAGPEDYVYDANGNIVELNSSDGMWMTYTYDKNNRVTSVTNQSLNLFSSIDVAYPTFTYVYEYYYNGFEKSKTDFNGTVSYTYDAVGRLSEVTDSATGATRKYDYDKAGNRTKLTETFANNSSGNTTFMGSEISYTSRVAEYEYSVVNTLKVAKDSYTTNTNGVATRITEYEYDKVGNEVSSTASYATSGDVAFNVIDGKDGGVIDSCVEYTINEYDGLNRLVYVNSVKNSNCDEATYTYNGDGLRVKSIVDGVTTGYQAKTKYYHYNGQKLMQITEDSFDDTDNMTKYIAGAMGYSAVREDGETLVYVKNAHGDVNATINVVGNVVDLYVYDEFGNVDYLQKNTDNRILYASEYLDTETGNYYLKARYYNPNIGRFTQRDPHWTPENMIYGDISETAPEPDVRSSDYAVYVPKPIQRQAMVLPTDTNKDDKVRGIIAETMAFGEGASYNGSLYDSYFAGFGVPEESSLFAIIYAQQADNGAILQSTNLYVYCTNNPVMYVDPSGEEEKWGVLRDSGTPENDKAILNDEGLIYIERLQQLYSLAYEYGNTYVMDAIHKEAVEVRQNRYYHRKDIDESLHRIYSSNGYIDTYKYANSDFSDVVRIDGLDCGYVYTSIANTGTWLMTEGQEIASGVAEIGFAFLSGGTYVDVGQYMQVASSGLFIMDQVTGEKIYLSFNDFIITIDIDKGLFDWGETIEFIYHDGENTSYTTINEDGLSKNYQ